MRAVPLGGIPPPIVNHGDFVILFGEAHTHKPCQRPVILD